MFELYLAYYDSLLALDYILNKIYLIYLIFFQLRYIIIKSHHNELTYGIKSFMESINTSIQTGI